jgi:predicted enzyme related to lactoylglutathione lyase
VTTGDEGQPGINGAFMKCSQATALVNTIDMPSTDEYIDKVVAAGGRVVAPKMAVPGVGYTAYLKDTEGNTYAIT